MTDFVKPKFTVPVGVTKEYRDSFDRIDWTVDGRERRCAATHEATNRHPISVWQCDLVDGHEGNHQTTNGFTCFTWLRE